MNKVAAKKKIIGRAEYIDLPGIDAHNVPARIDTGARTSAIWVSDTKIVDGNLVVIFFGKDSECYTGKQYSFGAFERIEVASSNGSREVRYMVHTTVRIGGKKIRARFTLANRSRQVYPVLIGRNVLLGKFIVDVSTGHALVKAEHERRLEAERIGNMESSKQGGDQ